MTHMRDVETVRLLTILQQPNADKARRQYLEASDLSEIDDQDTYDLFEERLFDAILSHETSVEMERELAQRALLILKRGIKRYRGGQRNSRHQELRKRSLVALGRHIKAEKLAERRTNATDAHFDAAEEAAEEGKKRGLNFAASYLGREMQRAPNSR